MNLQRAIPALSEALEVYIRADEPVAWAGTRLNLGLAYRDRAALVGADATSELTAAAAQVRAAAQAWTATDFPFYHQKHIAPTLEGLRWD